MFGGPVPWLNSVGPRGIAHDARRTRRRCDCASARLRWHAHGSATNASGWCCAEKAGPSIASACIACTGSRGYRCACAYVDGSTWRCTGGRRRSPWGRPNGGAWTLSMTRSPMGGRFACSRSWINGVVRVPCWRRPRVSRARRSVRRWIVRSRVLTTLDHRRPRHRVHVARPRRLGLSSWCTTRFHSPR